MDVPFWNVLQFDFKSMILSKSELGQRQNDEKLISSDHRRTMSRPQGHADYEEEEDIALAKCVVLGSNAHSSASFLCQVSSWVERNTTGRVSVTRKSRLVCLWLSHVIMFWFLTVECYRGTLNISNRALKFSLSVLSTLDRELPSQRIRSTSRPSRPCDAHLSSRFVPFVRLWDSVAALSLLVRGNSRVDRESSSSRTSRFTCEPLWRNRQRPHPCPALEYFRTINDGVGFVGVLRGGPHCHVVPLRLSITDAQRELLTRTSCVRGARCDVPDPDGSLRTDICSVRLSWNRRTILPRQRSIVTLVRGEMHRVARREVDKRHERPCRVLGIHRITRGRTYDVYWRRATSLHERRTSRRA